MSEPLTGASSPESSPPPAAPETATPSTEEHAVAYAERAVGVESRPEAPAEKPAAPAAPPPRFTPQQIAHAKFKESQRVRDLEATNARLLEAFNTLQSQQRAPAPAAPEEDFEPDIATDPQAWYLWKDRQTLRAIEERLKPVLGFVEQQTQRDQLAQQRYFEQQRYEAGVEQLRAIATDSEYQYFEADPLAAEGYSKRLEWYRDAQYQAHLHAGHAPQEAAQRVSRIFDNLVVEALRSGRNPAAYVDSYISGQIMMHPGFQGGNGNGNGYPPAALETPVHPEQQAIREMRAASQSPVARSVSQSAAAKGDTQTTAKTLMRDGGKNTKAFAEAVRQKMAASPGMSRQAATFQLMREAEQIALAQRK